MSRELAAKDQAVADYGGADQKTAENLRGGFSMLDLYCMLVPENRVAGIQVRESVKVDSTARR